MRDYRKEYDKICPQEGDRAVGVRAADFSLFSGIWQLFSFSPVCAVNYVTFLSERIRFLNGKIAQYTGNSAAARLYRLLCDRADADGRVTVGADIASTASSRPTDTPETAGSVSSRANAAKKILQAAQMQSTIATDTSELSRRL